MGKRFQFYYLVLLSFFTYSAYDPADYEHLPVSQEIKELFQYITRYVLFFTMPLVTDLSKIMTFVGKWLPVVFPLTKFFK